MFLLSSLFYSITKRMEKFYIVKFPDEEDAVEVIPKVWVTNISCYWPPACKPSVFKKLVKKCQEPDVNTWTIHIVKIIKGFGNAFCLLTICVYLYNIIMNINY